MLLWFLLTGAALPFVAIDIRSTPEAAVLKWGFVLTTAYTGVFGAFLYVLGCREPLPGLHERYVAVRWRQVLGSTIHCVAGDGVGILAGAVLSSVFGLSGTGEMIVEYVLGFAFGWTIFQALFMRDMAGGSVQSFADQHVRARAAVDEPADGGDDTDDDGAENAHCICRRSTRAELLVCDVDGVAGGLCFCLSDQLVAGRVPPEARHDDSAAGGRH